MNWIDNIIEKCDHSLSDFLRLNPASQSSNIRKRAPSPLPDRSVLPLGNINRPHRTISIIDKSGSMGFKDYPPDRLSDGQGGDPISIADYLKNQGAIIQVIGIAGSPSEVNESILKATATTDETGFNHYWFIEDSQSLIQLYEKLSTSIVIGRK